MPILMCRLCLFTWLQKHNNIINNNPYTKLTISEETKF